MTVQTSIARIELPWFPKELSPNARVHWRTRHRKASNYRHSSGWAAVHAKRQLIGAERIKAAITFHEPDRRCRDMDNLLASIKAGLDGVSDAIGIDDKHWSITITRGEPKPKAGAVVIELEAA